MVATQIMMQNTRRAVEEEEEDRLGFGITIISVCCVEWIVTYPSIIIHNYFYNEDSFQMPVIIKQDG